jgi:hypothetical protein
MQGLEAHKYTSTVDCVQKLLKNEGPMAFYKGVGPRLTRVCLEVGITMSLYGEIVKVLDKVCVANGRANGAFRNLVARTNRLILSPTLYYRSGRQNSRRTSNLEIRLETTDIFGRDETSATKMCYCAKIAELFTVSLATMSLALVTVYPICATTNSVAGLPS